MNGKAESNFFLRHPKKTVLFFVVISCFVLDVTIAKTYKIIFGYPWYERNIQNKIAAEKSFRIYSEIYHHDLAKNKSVDNASWGNITYRVFTDSLGFKNGSAKKISINSESKRILFIGDSFTEGNGIEYPNTFVGLISTELSKKGIEVLNAGVASYSPIIYWRKTKYLLEEVGLKFDELVVFIDFGDAGNELSYKLGNDGNIKGEPDNRIDSMPKEANMTLGSLIKNNSIFLFYMKNKVKSLLSSATDEEKRLSPPKPAFLLENSVNGESGLSMYYRHGYANGLRSMEKYMNMLYDLLEKRNIKMTIAIYPWPDQVLSNDLNNIHVSFWKDWSLKHNVKFLNYFPYFIRSNNSEKENQLTVAKYFIPGDIHWNEEGHRLLSSIFLSSYVTNDAAHHINLIHQKP
ncbi:MAG: SGNH/GDSL hydrolase family protein [Nitrospirae bacterium]|nr:SGNH/GDSL hydrolase family protein [Nitrospirota bacterium]